MGHSFHLGQEPFPKTTQPLYLTVPETKRLHVPRSPISDPTEDIGLIKSYLENKPQGLRCRKRLSAISRIGTQGKQRSLGIFHLSSNRFKYLLRPRSTPPAPAPSTNVTQGETKRGDCSSKTPKENGTNRTTIDTLLSLPGRRAEKPMMSMPLTGDGVYDEEELSGNLDKAGPKQGYKESPRPQLQRRESGTYDIVKDIPYLAPSMAERFSQQYERTWTHGSQSLLLPDARQKAGQDEHDLPSHKTVLASRAPIIDSVGRRKNATASVTFKVARNTDRNLQEKSSLEESNIGQESFPNTASPCVNSRGRTHELHKLSSSLIMQVDSREFPNTSNVRLPLEVGSPKDLISSVPSCVNHDSRISHIGPHTESFMPSPAPDLPLPPLPKLDSSPNSPLRTSRDMSEERNRNPRNSDPLRINLPLKSPARCKNINPASQDMQLGGFNATDVSQTKKKNQTMHRKSSFEGTSEASTSLPKPAEQAMKSEDLFIWRKIRNQRTHELKKRHLEQSRIKQGTSCQGDDSQRIISNVGEDTDDTIVLPSVSLSNRVDDVSMDSETNVGYYNKWNSSIWAAHGDSHLTQSLASPSSGVQAHIQRAPDAKTPSHYRDHSTQYTIPRSCPPEVRAPPVLPHANQSAREDSDHPKSMHCASCKQRRASGRKSHPPLHVTSEGAESLPSYLRNLEDRLEARLGAFERRTILLEAALLAVINTSANYDPTSSCHAGNRLSGMSGRSDASAPLGTNPEAIPSGGEGIGR